MTIAELEERSRLMLQRLAAFGVIWIFCAMFVVLLLPYAGTYFHIELGDFERALVNTTVSAINNAFFVVLGYLYGKSQGTQAKDDATAAGTKALAAAVLSSTPAPAPTPAPVKKVPLAPGETAAVTAAPADSPNSGDVT